MFRKRNSQALAFVCVVAMLITWNATSAYARVIANNLSANSVAVYYFNFTDAQVELIYDAGLEKIISIASVDPNDKVATTWGTLKKR